MSGHLNPNKKTNEKDSEQPYIGIYFCKFICAENFDINKGGFSTGKPCKGGYFSPYNNNPRLAPGPSGEWSR